MVFHGFSCCFHGFPIATATTLQTLLNQDDRWSPHRLSKRLKKRFWKAMRGCQAHRHVDGICNQYVYNHIYNYIYIHCQGIDDISIYTDYMYVYVYVYSKKMYQTQCVHSLLFLKLDTHYITMMCNLKTLCFNIQ